MVRREGESSETAPRSVAARHQRVAAGPPSPEHSKIKLDPRIARVAVGATLVALGVIPLALPTINSAAEVDVSARPPYSPAPTEQIKPTAAANGARETKTCVGSRTVTWTDAILTWDPETFKNSEVFQFQRTLTFPCVVPENSPDMCVRADPKDTVIVDEKDGTTPRLVDVIPLTTEGCRWGIVTPSGKPGR